MNLLNIKISLLFQLVLTSSAEELGTTTSTSDTNLDKNLQEITFDLGYGPESFDVYVQPNITSFSLGEHEVAKDMDFKGHAVKFFNMSPKSIFLFWSGNGAEVIMGEIKPFDASGTASFPGHRFFVADDSYAAGGSEKGILKRFYVDDDDDKDFKTNYYYDPITVEGNPKLTQENMMKLSFIHLEKYNIMVRNQKFNLEYEKATGREYLSMFPRDKPKYFIWPADYFGQEHWVTTKETHFKTIPSGKDKVKEIKTRGSKRILKDDEKRLMSDYRTEDPYLNITLKVMSCVPRVYEIDNFLSDAEVDHIIDIAKVANLKESTTGNDSEASGFLKKTKTRTSFNTWVKRETDEIIDAIYRRSADLLKIDEAFLRYRSIDEFDVLDTRGSIAEDLQLVHYSEAQEYTAHHDFGYSAAGVKAQGARFATLLFYLNKVEEGGQTEFPRWVNGETSESLAAEPRKGKAVLFYSQLPDGNMDDLSQHAALPVLQGKKYLINLWVSDPIR